VTEYLNKLKGDRRGIRGIGDGTRGLKPSIGSFKNGTLRVNLKKNSKPMNYKKTTPIRRGPKKKFKAKKKFSN